MLPLFDQPKRKHVPKTQTPTHHPSAAAQLPCMPSSNQVSQSCHRGHLNLAAAVAGRRQTDRQTGRRMDGDNNLCLSQTHRPPPPLFFFLSVFLLSMPCHAVPYHARAIPCRAIPFHAMLCQPSMTPTESRLSSMTSDRPAITTHPSSPLFAPSHPVSSQSHLLLRPSLNRPSILSISSRPAQSSGQAKQQGPLPLDLDPCTRPPTVKA